MPSSVWQAIFAILSALWSVEGSTVKAALVAELQSIAALANHAGSTELRAWAISQNEDLLLSPLRTRLEKLGVNASLR